MFDSKRKSYGSHFMQIASVVSEMSTCASGRKVGCVFVKDKRILTTGFNGVPAGYPHPETCIRRDKGIPSGKSLELCVCSHAEANGIANAARTGVTLFGSTVYCTCQPCDSCMGALANTGVAKVVFAEPYPSDRAEDIARHADIALCHFFGGGGGEPGGAGT